MDNPRTFFDSLPRDVLAEVAKKMVQRAERPLQLFPPSSAFRRASPFVFQQLNVTIGGKLGCDVAAGELTVGDFADVDILSIYALEACGPDTFTTVSISAQNEAERHFDFSRHPDGRLGSFIAKFCRTDCKVILNDVSEAGAAEWGWKLMMEVTRSVGNQADEVVFEDAPEEDEGEDQAALSLHFNSRFDGFVECASTFLRLKTFSYSGNDLPVLDRVWPHLGKSLERIEITSVDTGHDGGADDASRWATCLDLLQRHCRKLKSIYLWCSADDNDENSEERLVSLLTSYGGQLVSAWLNLNETSISSCTRIARICRNAQFDVVCGVDSLDRLPALNNRVESILLEFDAEEDWSILARVMESIQLVTTVEVAPDVGFAGNACVPEQLVKHMFTPMLGSLTSLTIQRYIAPHCVPHIAASTSLLKEIHVCFTTLKTVNLTRLVERNPSLESAHIEEGTAVFHDNKTAQKIAKNLISKLVSAQNVEQIKIQFFYRMVKSIFRDVLSGFRTKSNLTIHIEFSSNEFGRQ